jgi:adhesin/invasin
VTITAQLSTASGIPVAAGGRVVTWSKSGAGGAFGSATSTTNATGVASVIFTTGTTAGTTYTITARDGSSLAGTSAQLTTVAGPAARLDFTSSASPLASGSSRALSVQLDDVNGNVVRTDNGTVVRFARAGGTGTLDGLGPIKAASGVATLTVTGKGAGPVTISATGAGLNAATSFTVLPGPADAAKTTISAAPDSVLANGSSVATVTVRARDAFGNALTGSGGAVALSTTAGRISAVTDQHNGTYAALLSSPAPGRAVIHGTIGGRAIAQEAIVTFVAGCLVPDVRRMGLAAATRALERAHCSRGSVRRARSRTVARGRVVSQQPKNGVRVESGSAVTLVVSSGPRRRRR